MTSEIIRPAGFPLPEEEFHELKRGQIQRILSGSYQSTYSEWCLRGAPGESPDKIVSVVAIFPTPAVVELVTEPTYAFEPESLLVRSSRSLVEYWRDVTQLQIPRRVSALEGFQYRQLAEVGDQILQQYIFNLMGELLPTAMVAFFESRGNGQEEAAYLVCPTIIPPSAAFRHILNQAQLQTTQTL